MDKIEYLFESCHPNSKHVFHFTYCPETSLRMPPYGKPVIGDFLVFKYSTLSVDYMQNSKGDFAGRLNLERVASVDQLVGDLGGIQSSLIIPSNLSNTDAKHLWINGCGIRLVNVSSATVGVVIKRL